MLCTADNVESYEYDNDYEFVSYYAENEEYRTEEEKKAYEKMLGDLAYYTPIDDDNICLSATLISILAGLQEYM